MPVARLPKFLNLSAAGRMRVALPTAKLALIAFSCTLALVGMGAFVATLPSLSQDGAIVDAVEKTVGVRGGKDAPASDDDAGDAVDSADGQDDSEAQDAPADDADATGAATSGGASASGAVAASAGQPAGSGSASGSSASSDSGSSAGSGSSSSAATPSAPSSDASDTPSSVPADDLFSAAPSAADEQAFHSFLAGWYARLGTCEAEAAAGSSSTCWAGYAAVRDYVRSNNSKWCSAQENLIGAFRCLAWYAESGDESNLAQYRSYKAAVSL